MAGGNTYVVKPDGTGDFPTIQAALYAAYDGDEILLTDGVFKGDGNRNLFFIGKAVTVRSQNGLACNCIIDAEGAPSTPRRGFNIKAAVGPDTVIRDLTIRNGMTDDC